MKYGEIESFITKRLSIHIECLPNKPLVHIEVKNENGVLSSIVHCCMDVAKFSVINTSSADEFFNVLVANGFKYHSYSPEATIEIHNAYNSVLDSF